METEPKYPQQTVLSNGDFLKRVEAVRADVQTLTSNVSHIATLHQSAINSSSSTSSPELESIVTQTQVLNSSIKDQIKFLETDSARSKGNHVKETQVAQLKRNFTRQLQDYQQEEANYQRRYREQLRRQYETVNPDASEEQKNRVVEEAAAGDYGIFEQELRGGDVMRANQVLGNVRARHNDIQKIERTMQELQQLMEDLATTVVVQEEPVQQIEQQTENVNQDTEAANTELTKGIRIANRTRKMKWWCFWICVLIIIILALILGLYFGLTKN